MELKRLTLHFCLRIALLLIAPLMELKTINRKYSRKEYMSLLIAPLMELKINNDNAMPPYAHTFNRTAYGIENRDRNN